MKRELIKIVLTGPESTGKTSLSAALAGALETVWVPEFARSYVEYLGRPYVAADLRPIAAGQAAWEDWYAHRARRFLVCDTDWTVIRVWNAYRFGIQWPDINPDPAVYYFLCAPDFPWAPDPLREHPAERDVIFGLYANLLDQTGAAYSVLNGPPAQRMQTALDIVRSF